MKVWRIMLALLLCLALVGSTACNLFGDSEEEVTRQLVEVVRGDLTVSVSGSGSLDVSNEAELAFGVGGKINKISVEEGDEVGAGDVLARLDTGALELALTQVQLAKIQAEAAVAQAEAALDGAEYDLYILKKRHVSYEQQRIAKLQIQAAELQLKAANSQIESAEQSITEAQKQLDWAIITAPFDGIAARVDADEGDTILATQTIVYLIDTTTMELNAEVDEIDIPDVKLNQRAIIEVDALPALPVEGEVLSISPLAKEEAGVVLYEVKIAFAIPEGSGLKLGMSATADIIISERSNVLLVPDRAIEQDNQGNPIVKVMVNEQIQERPVVIGISDGFDTEIVRGLREGDVAVIEKRVKKEPGGLF